MYIGFAGVSGAGKSTIARGVADALRAQGYAVAYYAPFFAPKAGRLYKLGWSLYLWRWFDWELVRFYTVETTKKTWTKKTWWRIYMALIQAYYLDQLQKKYDVLIYDEDMIKWQALAVADGSLDVSRVIALYEEKVLPAAGVGVLVMVDTAPKEAARRFLARGDGSGRSAEVLAAETRKWHSWQAAARALLQRVTQETALEALTIDGANAVDHNVAKVLQTIETLDRS